MPHARALGAALSMACTLTSHTLCKLCTLHANAARLARCKLAFNPRFRRTAARFTYSTHSCTCRNTYTSPYSYALRSHGTAQPHTARLATRASHSSAAQYGPHSTLRTAALAWLLRPLTARRPRPCHLSLSHRAPSGSAVRPLSAACDFAKSAICSSDRPAGFAAVRGPGF